MQRNLAAPRWSWRFSSPLQDGHDVFPLRTTWLSSHHRSSFICFFPFLHLLIGIHEPISDLWAPVVDRHSRALSRVVCDTVVYCKTLHHTWPLLFWHGMLPSYIGSCDQRQLFECLCTHNYLKWKTYMHPLVSNQWPLSTSTVQRYTTSVFNLLY
jgi:hypothetical protein